MNYTVLKCVEDKYSADVTLYDMTDTLPDCFSDREYEHINLYGGTKYTTKPISYYSGCHILTIQK